MSFQRSWVLKRGFGTLSLAALILASRVNATPSKLTQDEIKSGWTSLFDGKSLDGWVTMGRSEGWAVEDGAIACTVKGGGYIRTIKQYKDYILDLEFKTDPRVNSGVFVRWEKAEDAVQTAMEIQVLDSWGRLKPDRHDCGALYDCIAPSVDAVRPAGEWNHMVITLRGPIIKVDLNGQQVVAADLSLWTTPNQNPDGSKNKFTRAYNTMVNAGFIGLQDHGGKVWYRNIKLRQLPEWQIPVRG